MRIAGLTLSLLLSFTVYAAGQVSLPEEKEEESIDDLKKEVIRPKAAKTFQHTFDLTTGYETNPRYTAIRKGDMYEEAFYSFSYNQPLAHDSRFLFDYDLDVVQYHEITDVSNTLNHVRLELNKTAKGIVTFGSGYDFSYLYYPRNRPGDFAFHKAFVYLKHRLTSKISQQFFVEKGWKNYRAVKALDHAGSAARPGNREDVRDSYEYSLGAFVTKKLYLRYRTRLSINDSNAQYQDFYDYKSVDMSPRLYYTLSQRLSFNIGMTYTRRWYASREVTAGMKTETEDVYSASAALRYMITPDDSFSVNYSYNEGDSNDAFGDYTGGSLSVTWRHDF